MTDTLDKRLRRFSNINLTIYDTLVARGLSEAEAERWAEMEIGQDIGRQLLGHTSDLNPVEVGRSLRQRWGIKSRRRASA
jgi:hypothetical protein